MVIGFWTVFRSEKIQRIRLRTVFIIPRKKALIPRHSEFSGRANSKARNGKEWNSAKKISFTKQQQNNWTKWIVCTSKVVFSSNIIEIFSCNVLFWVGFSSTEWFRTAFRKFFLFFVARKGSELCSLPRKCLERNSENLHLFWFHRTEFGVVFSSAEWFRTELWEFASIFVPQNGILSYFLFRGRVRNEFRDFLLRRTTGILLEITICSVYSVFRCLKGRGPFYFFHSCL